MSTKKEIVAKKNVEAMNVEELAAQATLHHDGVMEAMGTALRHARDAGYALIAAKAIVKKAGRGKWTAWLVDDENFPASPETARVYMRVARNWESVLASEVEKNPNLTLEAARQMLRPEPAEEEDQTDTEPVPDADETKDQTDTDSAPETDEEQDQTDMEPVPETSAIEDRQWIRNDIEKKTSRMSPADLLRLREIWPATWKQIIEELAADDEAVEGEVIQ